jgi:hypothetical protein
MSGNNEMDDELFLDDSDDDSVDEDESVELESDEDEAPSSVKTAAPTATTEKPADPPKRKRGRPKGVKAGPRPTLWACAALVNGKVVIDAFSAPPGASDEKKQNFSEEEAMAEFRTKYKLGATIEVVCYKRALYEKKGGYVAQNPRKKEIIPALLTEYEVGSRRSAAAIFHGWRGFVHEIRVSNPEEFKTKYGVSAEDCCSFWPLEEITVEGKKKSRPAPSLVLLSALEPTAQVSAN